MDEDGSSWGWTIWRDVRIEIRYCSDYDETDGLAC